MSILKFSVFSGGTITFDLDTCHECASKACIAICNLPNLGGVLELREGVPAWRGPPEAAAGGACTECRGCELECEIKGLGGVKIDLPMPELDAFLKGLAERGIKPGYEVG